MIPKSGSRFSEKIMLEQGARRPAHWSCGVATPFKEKSPGDRPGLLTLLTTETLGDLLHGLADAALDRLGGLGRDLLGEARELLALPGEGLELLTCMLGRKLDEIR